MSEIRVKHVSSARERPPSYTTLTHGISLAEIDYSARVLGLRFIGCERNDVNEQEIVAGLSSIFYFY